ncbi:hypothetical protein SEA_VERSE_58 [Streptomyces phage Verse]|uniref:Uncharacterized protein n=1 Tax=Streptomyces phage Verse TaxID=1673878 RepID=A0A0K1YAE3_9CAUD|nr:hypothetical protein SEA_VERSE_58 [Streptomyces phage Verse]
MKQLTPEEAILAIGHHLAVADPTNPTHVLDAVEQMVEKYGKLRLQQAAMIRRAQATHPNTLAAVAAAFARRAD